MNNTAEINLTFNIPYGINKNNIFISKEVVAKAIENADPAKRLQKLQNATGDLKTKADEAAQAYENINNNINNLDTAADKIKTLTKGTLE